MLTTAGNKKKLNDSPLFSQQNQKKRTLLHIKMLSGKILSPSSDQSIFPPATTGHITVEDGGINFSMAVLPKIDTAVIEEPAFDEITQNRDQSLIAETQRGPNSDS